MRFQRGSWGLRVFAIAFSILLWAMAPRPQVIDGGGTSGVVERPVLAPVEVRGLAEGFEVTESPDWVTIRLRGTRLLPIDVERVQVYVDMSHRRAGVHNVPVTVIPPVGTHVAEVDPAFVDVHVEPVLAKEFPVNVAALGLPSEASVEVLTPEPSRVQVVGRAGRIELVAEVIAPVRLQAAAGMQSGEVAVQAVDAEGLVVAGVRVIPERVFVTIVVTSDKEDVLETEEPPPLSAAAP